MNLQQPSIGIVGQGSSGESTAPTDLTMNHPRRRTRTRSNGSDKDEISFDNSADEEEQFVDHVSALLKSRQQQQQQQELLDENEDIRNNDACEILQHDDPPILEYDTSYDEEDDTPIQDSNYNNSSDNDTAEELLRAQQNRLRELMVQNDDDCWGADLSDDELDNNVRQSIDALSLGVSSASLIPQQNKNHLSHSASNNGTNKIEGKQQDSSPNSIGNNRSTSSNNTPKRKNLQSSPQRNTQSSSINIQNINYRHNMPSQHQSQQQPSPPQFSAKDQLLQQRIWHQQQRLYRQHSNEGKEKNKNKSREEENGGSFALPPNNNTSGGIQMGATTTTTTATSERIRQLTSESNSTSGLFTEQVVVGDDDNSSIVASNGGSNRVMQFGSSSSLNKVKSSPSRLSQQQQQYPSSSLNSLPTRPTVQSFPDEADRKRIVGCLAAILASSYTHETAPHLMVKKQKQQQSLGKEEVCREEYYQQQQQQQRYREEQSQQDESLNDFTSNQNVSNTTRPSPDVALSSISNDNKDDTSTRKKPQHEQNVGNNHPLSIDYNQSTSSMNSQHVLQPHRQQQQLIRQSSTGASTSPTSSHRGSTTINHHKAHSSSSSSHIMSNNNNNQSKSSSFHQSFTSSMQTSFQKRTSSFSTTTTTHNPSSKLKDELAEIRHRIRRHAIYSELLVSSADLLLLESGHAKAFLPMLEGLLTKVDEDNDNGNNNELMMMGPGSSHGGSGGQQQQLRESWKGRGFGGGGHASNSPIRNQAGVTQQEDVSSKSQQQQQQQQQLSNNRVRSNSVPRHDGPSTMMSKNEPNHVGASYYKSEKKMDTTSNLSGETLTTRGRTMSSSSLPTTATSNSYDPLETVMVDKDLIAPFLQTLTPGAGFSCIALLLLNHLLRDGRGYDARVRQAFKRLAVVVLSHELKVGGILREEEDDLDSMFRSSTQQQQSNNNEDGIDEADELARLATRKFEAMEHAIAAKLIAMSGETSAESETDRRGNRHQKSSASSRSHSQSAPPSVNTTPNSSTHGGRIALAPKETPTTSQHGISREQLLRGIKVGTAGAVGATLFALTGGLAAPGIAAGLAAVAGGSALAAGVTTVLSSAAAITTIFGVGGAGLAGYKMHRRTKGLTEFDFQKEQLGKNSEAELFSTVCISGWLRDARDFQRPWGVSPSHPRIIDKQELLERFYFIHNPDNVHRVPEILKHWKGRYFQLWRALQEKYGADPSNLFPLRNGPRISAELTHEEGLSVDFLMDELGYTPKKKPSQNEKKPNFFGMKTNSATAVNGASKPTSPRDSKQLQTAQRQLTDSSLKKKKGLLETIGVNSSELASSLSLFSESAESNAINDNSTHTSGSIPDSSTRGTSQRSASNNDTATAKPPPKHLLTVWDYHANYGGELYTVRWESDLLMELCDSVADQMIEWGVSATKTILHTTVFATLMTAVTLPYSLVLAANAIDSSWTMATERADRAGVELAKNLIDSNAGHRPVVLVGFSMGARVIYSCLKELARHQEIWEDHQQKKKLPPSKRKQKDNSQGDEQLKYIREPASIVEDAILMGTPNHISLKSWEACRRVVAGRLVNCYSRKDLILSLMFQMKKFQGILRAICGTSPVTVNGVENYDVTDLVTGHTDYCLVSGEILKRVRHGQPQRASVASNDVMSMVKIDFSLASLADEAEQSGK